jgi:16S rRNA (guanine527-N7)-methyltransferase
MEGWELGIENGELKIENEVILKDLLKEGAKAFNLDLNNQQIESLLKYKDILIEWNEKINLTAIEEDRDVIIKHYIDSFSILPYIIKYVKSESPAPSIIDVGTGAGFPGIPLKIALTSLDITLFDSLEKRVKFLNEVINSLNLKGIKAIHGRAEDYGVKKEYREKYDISVARAVANLPVLLEYCLPFVKLGGVFIAMKGSNIEEIANSKKALEILGGQIEEVKELQLPFSDIKRNIVIVKKLRPTPTKYPRKAGMPSKEPLF